MSQLSTNMPGPMADAASNQEAFWAAQAHEQLEWFEDFHTVLDWRPPYAEWFLGGKLNASYNCLDRHVEGGYGQRAALRWEGEPGDEIELTFAALHSQVCRFANVLKSLGVERGDRVAIYLPEIPELVITMLACARIGAVHMVMHCGLSSDSLMDRINDATAILLITADGYWSGGQALPLKQRCDEALQDTPTVNDVVVIRRVGEAMLSNPGRDHWYSDLMEKSDAVCQPEPLASEELLYLLYTSGATGRPKGIMHTTAGYLTQAAFTHRQVFNTDPGNDVFWCAIDTAWAPGHSYGVYGALLNGVCTFLYEGAVDFPEPDRFWKIVERHKITQLYSSPAMARLLMDRGEKEPTRHDLSSLRILATVGAPLRSEIRQWLWQNVGNERCPVIDTWWQTESGALMISDSRPVPGVDVDVVDEDSRSVTGRGGYLIVTKPWPAMMRGVWDAPKLYRQVYWPEPDGSFRSGDWARTDKDGSVELLGRAEDLIDSAGKRIAPIELEAVLNSHKDVAESIVVGVSLPESELANIIVGFVTLKIDAEASDELATELAEFAYENRGDLARLDKIFLVENLPRTSDGKYMRRLLREVAAGQKTGDTTALMDPQLIDEIRDRAAYPENWCWNHGPIEAGEVVIVDIDGVLADATERMRGIEGNRHRWPEYFDNAQEDDVIEEVARLLDVLRNDIKVVLLSARPLRIQDVTRAWLSRHKVRWDLMIMRATSSMQMPINYKRHRTQELRERGFRPILALEDDPRNVDMYHDEGVPCLYIRSGIHSDDSDS